MNVNILYWTTLIVCVVTYWLLPKGRLYFLLVASSIYLYTISGLRIFGYIGWGILLYLIAQHYTKIPLLRKKSVFILIYFSIAYLLYFKYIPGIINGIAVLLYSSDIAVNIVLPVGISYLTFKIIHYGIEVYRDKIQHHSCIQFLVYLLFFPIFTAGPIERFDHFLDCRDKKLKSIHIVEGCTRIIYGIIKKFFIAENLIMPFLSYNGITTKHLLENLNTLPPAILWIHVFLWYLYFYMDFSAYSDIAIGGSRLFGFTIQENFNHPLLARNIGEFWQRWHMTLANWCQNYIYLPLIGKTRNPHITVFTTMVIIGLWHEGNFHWALWGLYHATGIVIFRFWQKKKRAITILNRTSVFTDSFGRIVTMLFVSASYCFLITKPFGISAGLKLFLGLLGIKYL